GRPGLNSLALGGGLVLTVALDLLLIPRFGAMGAAVASTAAYLLADGLLVTLMLVRAGRTTAPTDQQSGQQSAPPVARAS
ncbi:MAG: polysaccharide biosynthesis C-terminal domain-containing protein, partial [Nocardioidaceae bacterium]